jgi:hypothetical protein
MNKQDIIEEGVCHRKLFRVSLLGTSSPSQSILVQTNPELLGSGGYIPANSFLGRFLQLCGIIMALVVDIAV